MTKSVDLGPNDYREKGKRVIRYVSTRPYNIAICLSAVWAVGVLVGIQYLSPWRISVWLAFLAAFAPAIAIFVTAVLRLDEETAEPPDHFRSPKPQRPKRERRLTQADLKWQIYRDE